MGSAMSQELTKKEPLIVVSDLNGVRTIRFNNPAKLNGWSPGMMEEMGAAMEKAGQDESVKAAIVTGTGKYYCAGVDFAGSLKPQHPRTMKEMIRAQNQYLFDLFIDFPKPLFVAANGPAIGASVTSATICDAIISSESATFLTPFKALGIVPEGCSSYTFPKKFGADMAKQILEGRKLSAQEALDIGFVDYVVPVDQVQAKAQQVAEEWVASGRSRKMKEEPGEYENLKNANAEESIALANALLGYNFLNHMANFSYEKGKWAPFFVFWLARTTRPIWSRL